MEVITASISASRTTLGLSAALSSYRSPFKKPLIKVLELVENVGAISDLSGKARLFLVLPVALLDAFFILWIFTSLSATLNKLQVYLVILLLFYGKTF